MDMLIEMLSAIWRFLNQQEVSNMSGLIGTAVSLYLLRTVKSVRRDFLFAARLPQYQESLQGHASSMNVVINAFDQQSGEITLLLELCKADLLNLEEKLAGAAKKRTKKSIVSLASDIAVLLSKTPIEREQLRNVYVRLNGVLQALRNMQEDQKWSVRDVG